MAKRNGYKANLAERLASLDFECQVEKQFGRFGVFAVGNLRDEHFNRTKEKNLLAVVGPRYVVLRHPDALKYGKIAFEKIMGMSNLSLDAKEVFYSTNRDRMSVDYSFGGEGVSIGQDNWTPFLRVSNSLNAKSSFFISLGFESSFRYNEKERRVSFLPPDAVVNLKIPHIESKANQWAIFEEFEKKRGCFSGVVQEVIERFNGLHGIAVPWANAEDCADRLDLLKKPVQKQETQAKESKSEFSRAWDALTHCGDGTGYDLAKAVLLAKASLGESNDATASLSERQFDLSRRIWELEDKLQQAVNELKGLKQETTLF